MSALALKTAAERPRFMAVVTDDVTHGAMVRVAAENGWPENQVFQGTIAEATQSLAGVATPELLIVDLSDCDDAMAAIAGLAEICDPGTHVIALGSLNDVSLYRELIDFGVEDYLLKPVSTEALNETVRRISEADNRIQEASDDGSAQGRLIAIVGARGGVGASTIAVNTAWMMAHEQGLKVALVDLDLYFGTIALALDLEPGRGFREALENPSRIDALFIERAMVRESAHLSVLAAEESLDNSFSFDPNALESLLENLRSDFDCIVVDLPRFAARSQISSLTPPSSVVVVSDPSLAGMRDTMRLVKLIKGSAKGAGVHVALNRVGSGKTAELSVKDFENGAELTVDFVIPADAKNAIRAEGAGKAMTEVGKGSKAAKAFSELARVVSARTETAAKVPFWQRFMRRG